MHYSVSVQFGPGLHSHRCIRETQLLNTFEFAFIWIAWIDGWKKLQFNQETLWKDFQNRTDLRLTLLKNDFFRKMLSWRFWNLCFSYSIDILIESLCFVDFKVLGQTCFFHDIDLLFSEITCNVIFITSQLKTDISTW